MGFFAELRKKIWRAPDRNFDQRFWEKFELEFVNRPARPGLRSRFLRWGTPVIVAAALAIVVVYGWGSRARKMVEEQTQQAQVLLDEELVDELDVLAAMEEHGLADLDDEDWDLLLSGTDHEL